MITLKTPWISLAKRSCLTLSENILRSKKVIILRGPTASGKTDLSLELAEKFPIDLISVDSVMVYKGLNIGSAKPVSYTHLTLPTTPYV